MNTKNNLTLSNTIDPDNSYQQLQISPCGYYIENQFKKILSEKHKTMKTKFSAMHLNIRSINRNFSQLTNLLLSLEHQFHAIGISETWLKDSNHLFDIENYDFIHSNRKHRLGGGVGLYLANNLDYKIRSNLTFDNSKSTDSLFVEVTIPKEKNIIIGVVKRAPDSNLRAFVKCFNEVIDRISKENKLCYLMGDFNVNLMNYQSCNLMGEFLDECTQICYVL